MRTRFPPPGAPVLVEICAPATFPCSAWSTDGDPLREATLAFPGGAPDIVTHEVRLPDGEYDVEVEIDTQEGRSAARKRVTLSGATATLDLRDER